LVERLGFWLAAVVKVPVFSWKLAQMDFLTIRARLLYENFGFVLSDQQPGTGAA